MQERGTPQTSPTDQSWQQARCSVKGLTEVTWAYVLILVGLPNVEADVMVRRFVAAGTGREVSAKDARALVTAASVALGVDRTSLDHAIWSWQRTRRPLRGR
jgi:hypothetical protein